MALEFVTGSKTFEITDYSVVESISTGNSILSERFTVGGYDWVIKLFPQGNKDSVSEYTSVFLKVLNATKDIRAMYSFSLWNWSTSKWSNTSKSSSHKTFSPSCSTKGYSKYIEMSDLDDSNYLTDDRLRIKCTLFVTPDDDKPAGNPSGAKISIDNGFHTASYAPPGASSSTYTKLPRQPTVRIYCEANKDLSVTVRNGTVVLAPADSNDYYQHWIKDMSCGDKVKDVRGIPVFALVNRVTGEALQNPDGENEEVSLVPYNTNHLDDSVKWTEMWSTGFRAIRIADTTSLNLTAISSDIDTNFSDGDKIVVKKWLNNPVQRWMIVPNVPC
ncbi:uncharacterized protein LOC144554523 [Carex rostrata]